MNKIHCAKAEEWILTQLDEGLEGRELERLSKHLAECPKCLSFQSETRKLLRTVAQDVPEDPGELYWKTYETSLEARLQEKRRDRESHSSAWRWKAVGAVLVASLAAIVVLLAPKDQPTDQPMDRQQKVSLIKELDFLYGPTDPAAVQEEEAGDRRVAAASARTSSDAVNPRPWFAVEDEPDQLLM